MSKFYEKQKNDRNSNEIENELINLWYQSEHEARGSFFFVLFLIFLHELELLEETFPECRSSIHSAINYVQLIQRHQAQAEQGIQEFATVKFKLKFGNTC